MKLFNLLLLFFALQLSLNSLAQVNRKFEYPMDNVIDMEINDDAHTHATDQSSFNVTFTSYDSLVYAIDKGEVYSVATVDSIIVLVVRDMDTLYAYSNLKTINVKRGDKITEGQVIGYAALDEIKNDYAVDVLIAEGQSTFVLKKKNFIPRAAKKD